MAVVMESVSVEQKTRDAGKAVAQFLADCKAAVKTGMPLVEAMKVAQSALSNLLPILSEVAELQKEAVEDKVAEATTIYLTGVSIYQALVN